MASKQTLGPAIGQRFCLVADTGLVAALPLRLASDPEQKCGVKLIPPTT